MGEIKVSVIVPVYNTEKYLKRCLDSLVNQTLKDMEIILIDDGSRETCAKLVDELAGVDSRIKVVHKENSGAGLARNVGLEIAQGEYVGFLDSDDYHDLVIYEKLYETAKAYEADLVLSGVCYVGGNMFSQVDGYLPKDFFEKDTVFSGEGIKQLLLGVVGALPKEKDDSRYGVGICKNLFRRELIEKNTLRFQSERTILSEDALFMVDFIKLCSRAIGIPGAYYCYCRNEDSLSKAYKSQNFDKCIVFLNEMEKRICDFVSKEEYGLYLDRLTQGYGRVLCSQEIVHARVEKIPFKVLRRRLKEICTQEKIRGVLKTYPWYQLPIKQAAFAFTMKYQLYFLQYILVILRDR